MLSAIKHKFVTLLQLLLVIVFIIFEEIIWEGIAKPVYMWVHSLKALEKIEVWLQRVNAGIILVLFVMLLLSVEMLGVYAGIMFVSGHVLTGLMIYAGKIPIAAFTFWMFRATENKLMRFGWFKWSYEKIMAGIDWIKALDIYNKTISTLKETKHRIKVFLRAVKIRYFSKESPFVWRLKKLYRTIKEALKRG